MSPLARLWLRPVVLVAALACGPAAGAPCAGFTDVADTNPFCSSIAWVRNRGITLGCNAQGTLFCPSDLVKREHMAAFISRLGPMLPPTVVDANGKVVGSFQQSSDSTVTPDLLFYRTAGDLFALTIDYYFMDRELSLPGSGDAVHFATANCTGQGYVNWQDRAVRYRGGSRVGVVVRSTGNHLLLYANAPGPINPQLVQMRTLSRLGQWGQCTAEDVTQAMIPAAVVEDLSAVFAEPFALR